MIEYWQRGYTVYLKVKDIDENTETMLYRECNNHNGKYYTIHERQKTSIFSFLHFHGATIIDLDNKQTVINFILLYKDLDPNMVSYSVGYLRDLLTTYLMYTRGLLKLTMIDGHDERQNFDFDTDILYLLEELYL